MTDDTSSGDVNIKVICRVRPLNSSEEKAGSKFVLKFPTDDSISCGVCILDSLASCEFEKHYQWLHVKTLQLVFP